jgi:hypothetical protein
LVEVLGEVAIEHLHNLHDVLRLVLGLRIAVRRDVGAE